MKNILFIHQSAELYGSDKTLLFFLKHIDRTKFNPVVILPSDGKLKIELEKENIKVVISPVLKLYRKMFSFKNLYKFLKDIRSAFKIADQLNCQYNFDIIYSNTLAVLLGIFYAKKTNIKHVWHVHEIIESPKIFTKIFRKLLALNCNSKIIYNSGATKTFWDIDGGTSKKSEMICNGLEIKENTLSNETIIEVKKKLFNSNSSEIVIALVGRISRWKGQKVLLNSFFQVSKTHFNIKLAFIGSTPPNQELFLEELNSLIEELQISDKVTMVAFTDKIEEIWQSIDIAVVPSTEPEPFGLVAVEAMLAKKPVIASNHGGLTEIIENNKTGFLVEPNNENALSGAIVKLVENEELRRIFGENGYLKAVKEFSVQRYVKSLEDVLSKI